jgi:hypothetical protein
MKKLIIVLLCLGMLAWSFTTFAGDDCSTTIGNKTITCQELGDMYFDECLKSISNGEEPEAYVPIFGQRFVPPEKGFDTLEYCYDYAKIHSDSCFEKCPVLLFSTPRYFRDDIIDPEEKAAQDAKSEKNIDCLAKSDSMLQECLDLPEGDKKDECMSKVIKWQIDCMD